MSNNTSCTACGLARKKKMLIYDENLRPFCASHWVCNENHPNHPNQRELHGHVLLMSYEEAQKMHLDAMSEHEFEQFKNYMTKPISIRISDIQTLLFLRDLQIDAGLGSFSEAIRYCINEIMTNNPHLVRQDDEITVLKPKEPTTEIKVVEENGIEEEFEF